MGAGTVFIRRAVHQRIWPIVSRAVHQPTWPMVSRAVHQPTWPMVSRAVRLCHPARQEKSKFRSRAVLAIAVLFGVTEPGFADSGRAAGNGDAPSMRTRIASAEASIEGVVDYQLSPIWQVGADSDEWIFGNVAQIIDDVSGNIYVLDEQLCHIPVFSPDGNLVRTIGREGEGPGEFLRPQDLFHVPGGTIGVAQVFPGKIVELSLTGDPAGDFPLPRWGSLKVFRAMGDAEKLVVAGSIRNGPGSQPGEFKERTFLKAFGPDGTELHHYHHEEHASRYGGMQFREPEFDGFEWRWALGPEGRLAVATSFDKYEVSVWNADGSPAHIIERPDFLPVQRTRGEKQQWQRYYESITDWNPGSTFTTEDVFPAISNVSFQADGALWVQSSRGTWRAEPGVLAVFDVYDPNGRFVREVRLRAPGIPGEDRVFLAGDRVYVVTQFFDSVTDADEINEEIEPSRLIAYTMERLP